MKALFLKDWLLLKAQYKFYMLVYLAFGLIGLLSDGSFILGYTILITSTIVSNLIQNDEICHWLLYADTTPLGRKHIVTQKYLFNLLLVGVSCVYVFVLQLLSGCIHGTFVAGLHDGAWMFFLYLSVGTLMTGVTLPLLYRFGTVKGRYVQLVLFGGIAGIVAGGSLGIQLAENTGDTFAILPLVVVALVMVAVVYPLSCALAVRWYANREL